MQPQIYDTGPCHISMMQPRHSPQWTQVTQISLADTTVPGCPVIRCLNCLPNVAVALSKVLSNGRFVTSIFTGMQRRSQPTPLHRKPVRRPYPIKNLCMQVYQTLLLPCARVWLRDYSSVHHKCSDIGLRKLRQTEGFENNIPEWCYHAAVHIHAQFVVHVGLCKVI